jgi:hypothetical protein
MGDTSVNAERKHWARIVKLSLFVIAGLYPATATGQERSGGSAWAIDAAGGAVGSLAGFGLGALAMRDSCEAEDLECYLDAVGAVVLSASVGSTLGAWAAGEIGGTEPSLLGAALGSLAGAVAGAGIIKLIDEADSDGGDGGGAGFAFVVTQGMVTALGSRIGAAVR